MTEDTADASHAATRAGQAATRAGQAATRAGQAATRAGQAATRAGHVALVGRPNVGKSTLLNALLGQKLSIVTPKAQTTRESVTGIMTTESVQAIFVDTPGLLEPEYTLQQVMQDTALAVIADADVVLLLLDADQPAEVPQEGRALEGLRRKAGAIIVAVNKLDIAPSSNVEELGAWSRTVLGLEPIHVSAATGAGVDTLRAAVEARLPGNPFFYPPDELAIQPVRFFVAELIRETIFEMLEQEVPYATIVRIEDYRETDLPVYIRATIYVERDSQKGIVVGRGGGVIRDLGQRSRLKIEEFIGNPVYLDLRVKTLPNWRAKLDALRYLGYRLPAPSRERGGGSDNKRRGARASGRRRPPHERED